MAPKKPTTRVVRGAEARDRARSVAREAEWREADRVEGEKRVLAWWRATWGNWLPHEDLVGPDGKPSDPTLTPVGRFGPVAISRAIALETEGGRAMFARVYRTGGELPSCEQFAMANEILHAMGVALRTNDPRVWHAVKVAHKALAISDSVLALEAVRALVLYRLDVFPRGEKWSTYDRFRETFAALSDDTEPKEALAALQRYSTRQLDVETVLSAVWKVTKLDAGRGARDAFAALAHISLEHGMFDVRPARTSKDRGRETKSETIARAAKKFRKAWNIGEPK